jgi:hypothetical protein
VVPESDLAELAKREPIEFAKAVKSASKDDIAAAMHGESRETILREVFSRYPGQFRPDRAGSLTAVIHWNITGRDDGGVDTFELVIADGACTLSPSPQHTDPKLAITVSGPDLLNLIGGRSNPMMMFMTGKLKAKGDLGLAANLEKIFELPRV